MLHSNTHPDDVVPALYILMRTDMASLADGKSDAHAGHAASAFAYFYWTQLLEQAMASKQPEHRDTEGMKAWHCATPQGFGTKLTMAVDEFAMRKIVANALALGFQAEVVNDPEYPLLDGNTVHLFSCDTCGYVFVPDKDAPVATMLLGGLSLKSNRSYLTGART